MRQLESAGADAGGAGGESATVGARERCRGLADPPVPIPEAINRRAALAGPTQPTVASAPEVAFQSRSHGRRPNAVKYAASQREVSLNSWENR